MVDRLQAGVVVVVVMAMMVTVKGQGWKKWEKFSSLIERHIEAVLRTG